MSDLPTSFPEGELVCFPVGFPQDAQFACIPAAPAVETVGGKPMAALLASQAGAVLSIQAVWQADEQSLAAARAAISARLPGGGPVQLAAADLADVTATLTLEDATLGRQTFGPAPASGTSANRAVFSETLTAAEKAAAQQAFAGKREVLMLAYTGTLRLDERARAEIAGELAPAVQALAPRPVEQSGGGFFKRKKEPPPPAPPPTIDACAAAVDEAIRQGQLRLTRVDTPNVSEAVRAKVVDALRTTLAKAVLDKIAQMGADARYISSLPVKVDMAMPETVERQVSGAIDLGDWAARNGGAGLTTHAAAPIPEPRR